MCTYMKRIANFIRSYNLFTEGIRGTKVPTSERNLSCHKVLDISMGLNHTAVIIEPRHVYTLGRNN